MKTKTNIGTIIMSKNEMSLEFTLEISNTGITCDIYFSFLN